MGRYRLFPCKTSGPSRGCLVEAEVSLERNRDRWLHRRLVVNALGVLSLCHQRMDQSCYCLSHPKGYTSALGPPACG
ncbi:unnamed protein product [Periconia digitata]|uniref:Uncharacterized protein n=1 Tax=Periconia digitata TaxID=1303443 RepID=A0A9W4U3A1_9PLEO|nr:unnamed protein product [Periconia digitata]